jgi:hypothetical protein
VGFSFGHTLGRSVNILRVARRPANEAGYIEGAPAHLVFSLYGRQPESRRVPGPWDVPGNETEYRTTALKGYAVSTSQLTELQGILAERPDPASLESSAVDAPTDLPFLPLQEAGQAIAARIAYVDTPELSGVAYVTGFRQDVFPFARDDFWYTFQGLSTDGRWYVSVMWNVRASMFPKRVSDAQARQVGTTARGWRRYIREAVAKLDGGRPTAFTPSLDTLDALVRSIDFESVVTPGPSPVPSVAPIVTPEPTDAAVGSAQPVAASPSPAT